MKTDISHSNFQKLIQQREKKMSAGDRQLKQKFALLKHFFSQAMEKLRKKHKKGGGRGILIMYRTLK